MTSRTRSRKKTTGKGGDGGFMALPHAVANSHNWLKLSPYSIKLLIDLFVQYKGTNNGDLCATWSMMVLRGWKSKATLHKALTELEHYGLLVKSRQGGRKLASLYGVTFRGIDECKGKLDLRAGPPLSTWRVPVEEPVPVPRKGTGWASRARAAKCLAHATGHAVTPGRPHHVGSMVY